MPKLSAPTKTQPGPDTWGQGASPEIRRFLQGPQPRRSELLRAVRIFIKFIRGFRALHFVGPCVTVFGSARLKEDHPYYALGREVGRELARAGFTVVTGGGPGIMEAANRTSAAADLERLVVTDSPKEAARSVAETAMGRFGLRYAAPPEPRWYLGER